MFVEETGEGAAAAKGFHSVGVEVDQGEARFRRGIVDVDGFAGEIELRPGAMHTLIVVPLAALQLSGWPGMSSTLAAVWPGLRYSEAPDVTAYPGLRSTSAPATPKLITILVHLLRRCEAASGGTSGG